MASVPYVNTNVQEIAGINQFIAIKDGSMYNFRFSLVDNDNAYAASNANVSFGIMDKNTGGFVYVKHFPVSTDDFKQYNLVLTGAPVHAYAWQINQTSLPSLNSGGLYDALLEVVLPDGREFKAQTSE